MTPEDYNLEQQMHAEILRNNKLLNDTKDLIESHRRKWEHITGYQVFCRMEDVKPAFGNLALAQAQAIARIHRRTYERKHGYRSPDGYYGSGHPNEGR